MPRDRSRKKVGIRNLVKQIESGYDKHSRRPSFYSLDTYNFTGSFAGEFINPQAIITSRKKNKLLARRGDKMQINISDAEERVNKFAKDIAEFINEFNAENRISDEDIIEYTDDDISSDISSMAASTLARHFAIMPDNRGGEGQFRLRGRDDNKDDDPKQNRRQISI